MSTNQGGSDSYMGGMKAAHQNTQFTKEKTEDAISKVPHEQRSANTGKKSEQHKRKKCYRCGKQGHAAAECQLKIVNATSVEQVDITISINQAHAHIHTDMHTHVRLCIP